MVQPLQPGTPAPDFELKNQAGETIRLSNLRGKPVVLAFYPFDWSSTCTEQLSTYQSELQRLEESGAHLLAISIDSDHSHRAWAEARGLTFSLLSDFHPKAVVASAYGVYREDRGFAARVLFIVDADGIIRFTHEASPGAFTTVDAIVSELRNLQGEAAPA